MFKNRFIISKQSNFESVKARGPNSNLLYLTWSLSNHWSQRIEGKMRKSDRLHTAVNGTVWALEVNPLKNGNQCAVT
jgi:hypothetical protein